MTRRKSPKPRFRFTAVKNSPYSDDDAAVIGSCLQRIAEDNAIDGIRSLDKDLVLEQYEEGNAPELSPYLEQNKTKAQREYWLIQIGAMIRSIRVMTASVKRSPLPHPRPQFLPVKERRGHASGPIRSRVITEDVLAHDPLFASAFGLQVRIVDNALKRLEHLVEMQPNAPAHMLTLPSALRTVLDDYLSQVQDDKAA